MNLDLLIFGKQKPDSPLLTQLTINSEDDVKRLRAYHAGSVGVAAVAQLETLAAGFPGAVDKLRKKPKAKQLDDLMFRKEKVPLMDVRFAERSGPAGKPERFGYHHWPFAGARHPRLAQEGRSRRVSELLPAWGGRKDFRGAQAKAWPAGGRSHGLTRATAAVQAGL